MWVQPLTFVDQQHSFPSGRGDRRRALHFEFRVKVFDSGVQGKTWHML